MYHLRLIKSLSYIGVVTATKKNPDIFVEDKAAADAAEATGYFKIVGEKGTLGSAGEDSGGSKPGEGYKKPGKKLEEMTVPELESFAVCRGISLKGISKKADIIAKLKEDLGGPETENEVDYGSPVMMELLEQ